jgi:hypothetical protein
MNKGQAFVIALACAAVIAMAAQSMIDRLTPPPAAMAEAVKAQIVVKVESPAELVSLVVIDGRQYIRYPMQLELTPSVWVPVTASLAVDTYRRMNEVVANDDEHVK